jgi:hypothetical protein
MNECMLDEMRRQPVDMVGNAVAVCKKRALLAACEPVMTENHRSMIREKFGM